MSAGSIDRTVAAMHHLDQFWARTIAGYADMVPAIGAFHRQSSAFFSSSTSTPLRTSPRRDPLLLRILRRCRLHQGPHQRLIRRNPVTDDSPLRAVPLLEPH